MLVGADAPAGMGEDSLVIMRVDPPKSAGNGSSGEHGSDDLPEQRQGLREPDAGEVEEPAEMERQVRDQLYGPGFRRR